MQFVGQDPRLLTGQFKLVLEAHRVVGGGKELLDRGLDLCLELLVLGLRVPEAALELLDPEAALEVGPLELAVLAGHFLKSAALVSHLFSDVALEGLNVVEVTVVDLPLSSELVDLHLHRLVVDLELLDQLPMALVVLKKLAVLPAGRRELLLQPSDYLLQLLLLALLHLHVLLQRLNLEPADLQLLYVAIPKLERLLFNRANPALIPAFGGAGLGWLPLRAERDGGLLGESRAVLQRAVHASNSNYNSRI